MKSNNIIQSKQIKSLHYVYIVHCTLTNEYYFGKHSTNNKNDGYGGSGSELNRRKKELGKKHFVITPFALFENEDEAYDHEEDLIRVFISDIKCLNKRISSRNSLCDYGIFKYPSGKIVKLHINDPDVLSGKTVGHTKGKPSPQKGIKTDKPVWNKGKPLSEEHKQKLRKPKSKESKQKSRKPLSEKHKQNISKGKGFDLSTFSNEEISLIKNLRSEKVSCNKISTILFETFNRKLSAPTIRKYF